ncbi:MAG: 3-isopropylmalate dehydratase [Phototrophicaceae bacterium]|jgi:3-isopropylmalate/(R)-2-methylmalate dehydratase small subunit
MTLHRVWKYGDHVNTDVIFPGKYTYTVTERAEMAQYALQDLDPTFASNARPGDVIVAGRNWGNGSSREQAVIALVELGIRAVIAHSFARIYYRNAINSGLLVIVAPQAAAAIQAGEQIGLDIATAQITCAAGVFSMATMPESVQQIVAAGGLIPYLQANYKQT